MAEKKAAEEKRLRVKAEEASAERLRAKKEEELRHEEARRQAEEEAMSLEEARLRAKEEDDKAAKKAEKEQAALRDRCAKLQQLVRESEERENALNEEMKRVRFEKEVQEARVYRLREEAKEQAKLQEAFEKTTKEYGEARKRDQKEREVRLRSREEIEQQQKQLAASQEQEAAIQGANSRARMGPLVAAELQARSEVLAMIDRESFLAEAPLTIRNEVKEAQGILDAFQASAESQLQTVVQYELASHAQSTHRV